MSSWFNDSDNDGVNDYSAGTVGARIVDIYGVISDKAEFDDRLNAINGTLLPAMDSSGNYFGVMNDSLGMVLQLLLQLHPREN